MSSGLPGGPVAGEREAADQDVAIDGVAAGPGRVGEVDQPLAVGRGVGRRVVAVVAGDPLGLGVARAGAGGGHPPDVAIAGAVGEEVDPAAVGRILGGVVGTRAGREPALGPALGGDRVDVEPAPAIGRVGEPLAVGRPGVEVPRRRA